MDLGRKLRIRSIVNLAAEVIPYFWPMRNFVHHNPLHEIEGLPFKEAVEVGKRIFGGRPFLSRKEWLHLMNKGHVRKEKLRRRIGEFLEGKVNGFTFDPEELFYRLVLNDDLKPYGNSYLEFQKKYRELVDILKEKFKDNPERVCYELLSSVSSSNTLCTLLDLIFGKDVASSVDELMIKISMDFLDEGQSAVSMPQREEGFYRAWRNLVLKSGKSYSVVRDVEEPEEAIDRIMETLGIPEDLWEGYFTLELSRLKGIVGYIRWRSQNKDFFWQREYPIDVVEYLAVRLIISKTLMDKEYRLLASYPETVKFIENNKEEVYLRYEYNSGNGAGPLLDKLPDYFNRPEYILDEYIESKAEAVSVNYLRFLDKWLALIGKGVDDLDTEEVISLIDLYEEFVKEEGYLWLLSAEDTFIEGIINSIDTSNESEGGAEVQALFCIDVRSERFRRNLEKVGNYKTFGIAGFFGVPIAFVELRKSHEEYLCPVLIKPRNVVIEIDKERKIEEGDYKHLFKEILHDLKENVFTPYITVEAIGFLFGFDFIGKTFFPLEYSRIRERITESYKQTDILIDKLSREEVEEVIDNVYKISLKKILKYELSLKEEDIGEDLLENILKVSLEGGSYSEHLKNIGVSEAKQEEFFKKLRDEYRIERGYRELLIERLKNIGFSVEEQATLVGGALQSIGLTRNFAKLVLVLGHGSKSDNNPYESALDCGACGGASGIHNARVFCKMANNPKVRVLLKERFGIDIPEDTFFLPGIHNTTTDDVYIYDTEVLPAKYSFLLEKVKEDLFKAKLLTSEERYIELFDDKEKSDYMRIKEIEKNAYDWSQVRPEWGLSGNFAMIIGRRALTEKANLRGKVFLHSYDYRLDKKGFILENILSGPLIVAHWINMEHYFSTVDNEVYGSGSKVYHNVVGRIGVMTGNFSDLRTGLPSQTVLKEGLPFHVPIRLIVLLEAPFEFATSVISRVYKVRELLENGWMNFIIFDPESKDFYVFRKGNWHKMVEEVVHEGA